jgi:hypothetical protein
MIIAKQIIYRPNPEGVTLLKLIHVKIEKRTLKILSFGKIIMES